MFHIHICEKNTVITEGTVNRRIKEERKKKISFFHLKFRLSDNVLSLHLYLNSQMIRNRLLYSQEIKVKKKNHHHLIAFKLICLYCKTQERADRGRKSGKSIMPLCLPPSTICHTPTLPLCSGLQELQLVHRTAATTREGMDTSLITPAISASIIKHRCL